MKKAIALFLALTLVFGIALLAGCGGKSGDALKGTWEGVLSDGGIDTDISWVFDGKGGLKFSNGYYDKQPGTYKITGDKVELNVDGWENPIVYSFTVEGKKLTMTADNGYSPKYELTKK